MRLKELRKQRKINQQTVADVLNCSQAVYSRYENGDREPPLEALIRLADFYGVTLDELVGRDVPSGKVIQTETVPPQQPNTTRVVFTPEPGMTNEQKMEILVSMLVQKELEKRGL